MMIVFPSSSHIFARLSTIFWPILGSKYVKGSLRSIIGFLEYNALARAILAFCPSDRFKDSSKILV